MKKTLLALSAAALIFTGCSNNKISDENTKLFETSLNNKIKDASEQLDLLSLILTGGVKIDIDSKGYKCENKQSYITCSNPLITISLKDLNNDFTLLEIKNISLKTNDIYVGNKKGFLNMKEVFEGMPKEIFNETNIDSIQFGEYFKSVLENNGKQELASILNDDFSISSKTNIKNILNNGTIQIDFDIKGKNNKNEFNLESEVNTTKEIMNIFDKMNIGYNTSTGDVIGLENAQNVNIQDLAEAVIIKKINSKLIINNDLSNFKQNVDDDLALAPEPVQKILNEFFNNKPHKIVQTLSVKNNFNLLKAIDNSDNEQVQKDLENVDFKINGVDIIKAFKNYQ